MASEELLNGLNRALAMDLRSKVQYVWLYKISLVSPIKRHPYE